MHVAGVDGCRGGWLCVDEFDGVLGGHIFESLAELLDSLPTASIVAIDIPIGLPDSGERQCDPVARKLLRAPRASSVFPAPIQAVVSEIDYQVACRKHREIDGRALSRQAFAILPKIHEVNVLLGDRPALQDRVREIHPEVCFAVWNNGIAMQHRKSDPLGGAERERLIDGAWPGQR
jgi:predicted RNase H-like nuclease